MSRGYAHTQLRWFYLVSTSGAFHVRKNTRLSTPAQLHCSHSGAWEPGNEANNIQACLFFFNSFPDLWYGSREYCTEDLGMGLAIYPHNS